MKLPPSRFFTAAHRAELEGKSELRPPPRWRCRFQIYSRLRRTTIDGIVVVATGLPPILLSTAHRAVALAGTRHSGALGAASFGWVALP